MYEDKTLVCKDCGNEFIFSAGEQAFYAEKGFQNEPTRCRDCRMARKATRPLPALPARCSTLCAPNAVSPPRFPSSPVRIVPCSAASASLLVVAD